MITDLELRPLGKGDYYQMRVEGKPLLDHTGHFILVPREEAVMAARDVLFTSSRLLHIGMAMRNWDRLKDVTTPRRPRP